MKNTKRAFMLLATLAFAALSLSIPARLVQAQRNGGGGGNSPITYPATKKVDVVDDYFGTKVADPYRWLEDNDSPEVAAWVEAQNKVTFGYLDQISYRAQLKDRLMKLFNYAKFGSPQRRGDQFMSWKNDGLQNQNVYYIQKGLDGTPELLLDPNKFSADGTSRLGAGPSWSPKGKYILYGISQGGSDWNDLYVMDVATKQPLNDHLKWIKNGGGSWRGDEGFFYSRYPEPEKGRELYSKNEFQSVWYHKIGTPQTDDELIYEDKANPQRFQNVNVTEDGRFAFLYVSERGKGKDGNALYFRDLSKGDKTFTPIVSEITNDGYSVRDDINEKFLIETNHGAPNGKVVLYDPATKTWTDIIPEKAEPLQSSGTAGGKLFVTYLTDVVTRAYVYSLKGNDYEVKETFYISKDGTRVPLFLTYKKGIKLDGNNPTLLYGYGGFNIVTNPSFSPLRIALLEQGFVYASANMRGGGEYGEKWHEAGTKLKKQNVFDDFIAAAEYLISQKYTSPARLAIDGASNGGLLVGAVANQRPDLFRAVHQHAGVMDMLRYQKFTIGWNWAADYGRSDANEAEFKALYAYSPIHNVKPGTK